MRPVADGAGAEGAGAESAGAGQRVPGRWLWAASGVVTAVGIAVPAAIAIGHAGVAGPVFGFSAPVAVHRAFTYPRPASALTVNSNGAMVRITAGRVSRITVTETIVPGKGPDGPGHPSMRESESGGRLTLTNTACVTSGCVAAFTITVPAGVTADISSAGGPVSVAGIAGAKIDSAGGAVTASQIDGPLTATTEGGLLMVNGQSGPLDASTGGGTVIVQGATSATAGIDTRGGPAIVSFAAAPRALTVQTGGGTARISVPGGTYALTADSGGGPESVDVPTSPSAPHSLTVVTGGGPLFVG